MARRQVTFLITANAKQFQKTLASAQYKLKAFGRKTERLGRSIASLAAPLAIAGAASVKMASDFQASMTKIQTLVGLSAESVQGMRKDVLNLAKQTGRGPKELADALFAVTSAGLRGEQAMSTLEKAAKASAIGLGDTKDIARALTGILQSYSKQGLSAADATDTLIGVVRQGNLEASELAPVLGRVTGIASQLGISFSQVGASIASFTRLGVGAEEAVTGLRGIMNALLKQTPKAQKALASVGLTFDSLTAEIQKKGLARALVDLVGRFKDNQKGLAAFAGRVRGLAAIMGTAGAQSKSYLKIADSIADSTGNLNKGFATVSKTIQFQFQKAFANLKVEATKLGTVLFPMAIKLIDYISSWVKWFGALSDQTKKNIFTWAKWTGIIGGSLLIFGKLSLALSSIIGLASSLVGVIPGLIAGFEGLNVAAMIASEEGLAAAVTSLTTFEGLLAATGIGAIIAALAALGVHAYKSYQQTKKLHDVLNNLDKVSLKKVNKRIQEVQKLVNRGSGLTWWDNFLGNADSSQKALEKLIKRKRELIKAPAIHPGVTQSPGNILSQMGLGVGQIMGSQHYIMRPTIAVKPKIDTGNAGGGRGGGGLSDAVKNIYTSLDKQLNTLKVKFSMPNLFPKYGKATDRVKAYTDTIRSALSSLLNQSVDPLSAGFQKLAKKIQQPFKGITQPIDRVKNAFKGISKIKAPKIDTSYLAKANDLTRKGDELLGNYNGKMLRLKDISKQTAQTINRTFASALANITKGLAQGIINIASGSSSIKDLALNILGILGDLAIQIGTLFITLGSTVAAALNPATLFASLGTSAIVAGGVLVAAGAALKAILSAAQGGHGMADGGIVPSGFPNDSYPAMLTSGETVIPKPHPLPSGSYGRSEDATYKAFARMLNDAELSISGDKVQLVVNRSGDLNR